MRTTFPTLSLLDGGQHVIWEEEGALMERVSIKTGILVVPHKTLASSFTSASKYTLAPGESSLLQSFKAGSFPSQLSILLLCWEQGQPSPTINKGPASWPPGHMSAHWKYKGNSCVYHFLSE